MVDVRKNLKDGHRKKSQIQRKIVDGGVEKTLLPYVDWRVNPLDLDFNDQDISRSLLKETPVQNKMSFKSGPDVQELRLYKDTIGKGAFGSILLGQLATGEWIVVKVPNKNKEINALEEELIQEEIKELKNAGSLVFYDEENHVIGMNLLKGHELFKAIVKNDNTPSPQDFSLLQRLAIAKDILKKITALHKDVLHIKGVRPTKEQTIHRDIKSNNLMLYPATHTVEYCDFGFARRLIANPDHKQKGDRSSVGFGTNPTKGKVVDDQMVGTPMFLAPELISCRKGKKREYNEATEIFAIGMTLAEIFGLAEDGPKIGNIPRYTIVGRPDIPNEITDFIRRMVDNNPKKRPTAIEAAIFFNQMLAKEGKKSALKTCVISIDDFLLLDYEGKKRVINEIISKKINAVALQGSEQTTYLDYYKARYLLIRAGIINVAPFMVKGQDQNAVLHAVKDHYDQSFASLNTEVFVLKKSELKRIPISSRSPSGFFARNPWVRDALVGAGIGLLVVGGITITAVTLGGALPVVLGAGAVVGAAFGLGGTLAIGMGLGAVGVGYVAFFSAIAVCVGAITRKFSGKTTDKVLDENKAKKEDLILIDNDNDKNNLERENQEWSKKSLGKSTYDLLSSVFKKTQEDRAIKKGTVDMRKNEIEKVINTQQDINGVVAFLTNRIEFFSAPFEDNLSFEAWARINSAELKSLSDGLKSALPTLDQQAYFFHTLIGSDKNDVHCLRAGNEKQIRWLLTKNPDLITLLKKHTNSPVIDTWYRDNVGKMVKQRNISL